MLSRNDRADRSEVGQIAHSQPLASASTRAAEPLRLVTLGQFALRGATSELLLSAGKPLALITYLHSLPSRSASRDHLLHTLWGDVDEERARHALRQTVWQLRRLLGDSAFDVKVGAITLGALIRSDVDDFLAAVERNAPADAVAIYSGEFLKDFVAPGAIGFEHWAESERQRCRLLFQRCAESVIRQSLSEGRLRHARDLAMRMRDTNPDDETGWRLLLEAALQSGDRVTAHAEARRLEDLLAGEARDPEPATKALLARAREDLAPAEGEVEGMLVADLVGRESQFSALVTAFRRVRRHNAECIELFAPAGVGKTRLLRDFARHTSASSNACAYVRALPGDRDVAWSYAAELVRQVTSLPGALGVSPASASSLVALDPSLSGRWSAVAPDSLTGEEAFRRRVAALEELIRTVCDEQPLALLLDDLHWADTTSRTALDHVLSRLHDAPLLAVAASRTGTATPLAASRSFIQLQPLDENETESFVVSLGELPGDTMPDAFVTRLRAATHGSPLLILETLKLALDAGCLTLAQNRWSCPDPGGLAQLLDEGSAISRRIARLTPAEREALLLFAVAEGPLTAETLAAAARYDAHATSAIVARLEHGGFVVRVGNAWIIAHDEIAAGVRDSASNDQITAAHGKLGEATFTDGASPALLRRAATHFNAAGLDTRLTAVSQRWVRQARATGDRRHARVLTAELLGIPVEDSRARALYGKLPVSLRLHRARSIAFATAALLVIAIGGLFALQPLESDALPVTVAAWLRDANSSWRLHSRKLASADVARGALELRSIPRTKHIAPDRPRGVIRPGSPDAMVTTQSFPDSGGEDVVLMSAGSAVRLTRLRGDDVAGAWSPDGRYLAIQTDRWSALSMSDIAIIEPDRGGALVRRLTRETRSRDVWPLWSPDGSRIAFVRARYESLPDERVSLCVVSVDGAEERCVAVNGYAAQHLVAWASTIEIVGVFVDAQGVARLLVIDVENETHRELAEGTTSLFQSHAPGWVVCFCRRDRSEPFQLLLLPVDAPQRGVRIEPGDPPVETTLFPVDAPRLYLDRMRIEGAERTLPADGEYQLRLLGWDAAGRPMEPRAVRWSSSDTNVAAVSESGRVRARRPGRVMIRATSGGWRSDSAVVTMAASDVETVVQEHWSEDFTARWALFGDPLPMRLQGSFGAALAPNGDSTFGSGAYLRRALPTHRGVGVEIAFSAPITSRSWQQLDISLVGGSFADLKVWDHSTGHFPLRDEAWRSCRIFYPHAAQRDQLELFAGLSRSLPVPPQTALGEWRRVRIQIFEDGRCGIAVDGRPLIVLDRSIPMGDSALLVISAYSHRTRILVGDVSVWLGVRRDLNWMSDH